MTYGDDRVGPDLDTDTTDAVFRAVSDSLSAGPLPQFGSPDWVALDEWDVLRYHAVLRAALAWWTGQVFGPDPAPDRAMADASKAVQAADPAVWRRVARDRAIGVPQGSDRRTYPPVPLPRANSDLQAAFERAARGDAA
jgi:hypothetical protein